jgi:hypothetical protein
MLRIDRQSTSGRRREPGANPGVGVNQTLQNRRRVDAQILYARLHYGARVFEIDFEDLVHARKNHRDSAFARDGAAQSPVSAPRPTRGRWNLRAMRRCRRRALWCGQTPPCRDAAYRRRRHTRTAPGLRRGRATLVYPTTRPIALESQMGPVHVLSFGYGFSTKYADQDPS